MKPIELVFNAQTKKLQDIFLHPWSGTWEGAKKLWGDDVRCFLRIAWSVGSVQQEPLHHGAELNLIVIEDVTRFTQPSAQRS